MVDRLLGGTGQGTAANRGMTEIEQNVTDGVIGLILENLTEAWQPIISNAEFRISGRDTRPEMLQVAAPNEAVIVLVFDVKIGEVRGMLNVCLPAVVIESVGSSFTQGWQRARRAPDRGRSVPAP